MNVQIVRFEPLLQKPVRGNVLDLLQRVHLGQLVLDGELVLRIDVRHKLPQRRFRREYDGFVEAGFLQVLELLQTRVGVLAEPRPERGNSTIFLKFDEFIIWSDQRNQLN